MYNSEWFQNLNKPFLNPPSGLFQPVWTILYILMIISLINFILVPSEYSKKTGYVFFVLQLVLNLIWSPVFFGMKNIALAFLVVVSLDISVVFLIREFYKVSKPSAYMLIPYLLWILFATYLNGAYFVLN